MMIWLLAAVKLAAPFTDGAVLQRDTKVPVWGTADAGEAVCVSFAGQEKRTTAGADGRWRVDLDPMTACAEGRVLAANGLAVKDVLVGEVWLASGQSNMGIPFWGESPRARDRYGYQVGQIISRPTLRFAILDNAWSDKPQTAENVRWRRAERDFLLNSGISAVAVWYGLYLHDALGIPVGLVGAYVGATVIETWIPDCTLECPAARRNPKGQNGSQYFNGKIAPICPYALRGAIWYQGEANTYKETIPLYPGRMRLLIDGWKRVFENPRLQFHFAQLCPWGDPLVPAMQETQERFAASDPDVHMAVLCDSGNLHDIHPNNKEVVGLRLALLSLRHTYGRKDVIADSPTLKSWRIEDGKFVMAFDNVKKWSIYDPDWRHHRKPEATAEYGFEVCGADGKWTKAQIGNLKKLDAKCVEYRGQITNEELVVFSPEVKDPKALRYLHSSPWRGYLMNEAGLPVGAFHIGEVEACATNREPKISVFANFVQNVAKQRGVTLDQAASWMYDLGVRGFDCSVFEPQLPQLAATKLKPINLYYFPKWTDAASAKDENARALDAAAKYAVPRIMTIPPNFTDGGDQEAEFDRNTAELKAFVAAAKARGVTITIEDFGGTKNACSHAKYLKRMFDAIPDLRFALDSGNLYYAGRGDDILDVMNYAKDRIEHVHLKDQTVENNRKYATLGLGAVPNEKIVKATWASGYDGWYTLENAVGDVYDDTVRQIAVFKAWIAGK